MSGYLSRSIGADRLPTKLSAFDVDVFFHLPADAIDAIKARFSTDRHPGAENRLIALAAQVEFLRTTGRPFDNAALIPSALWRSLGDVLGLRPPTIASLRSMYKRRMTLHQHQQWARQLLGIENADGGGF